MASRDSQSTAAATSAIQLWKKTEAYLLRLPVLTRVLILAIAVFHSLEIMGVPIEESFALDPKKVDLLHMHRLNTYPLVHMSLLHATMNIIALTPLLERFEREIGSLKTLLLIAGPIVTFPGGLYLLLEVVVFRGHTAVAGASALVFTLLGNEAIKTYAFRPYYAIAGQEIPSWSTPIFYMVLAAFLVPSSSLTGHFCGLVIGYAYACRYLRLLEPSEWILSKVEDKLGFLFRRIPYYVSLEKRTEMNYWEFLPTSNASGGARHGGGGGNGLPMATATAMGDIPPAFAAAGPGRPLGS